VDLEISERKFRYGLCAMKAHRSSARYVDFEFAGDVDSRRSIIGCLHARQWSSMLVSRLQKIVALSTTEA